jgi:hypothetical protein
VEDTAILKIASRKGAKAQRWRCRHAVLCSAIFESEAILRGVFVLVVVLVLDLRELFFEDDDENEDEDDLVAVLS